MNDDGLMHINDVIKLISDFEMKIVYEDKEIGDKDKN